MAIYTPTVDHQIAKTGFITRLAILRAAMGDGKPTERMAQLESVIATYNRLYPSPRVNLIDCTPK